MNNATELSIIDEHIDRLYEQMAKMKDADAIRAVRTIKHLEARINEIQIQTGRPAGAW